MSISVLITSYNYRNYVVEAIESALSQSVPPHEVIVVDDGSTDGSADLLQEKYRAHAVVQILCTPNRGQLAAFVTAFRKSTGGVIAFLDADDRLRPGYLDRIAATYAAFPSVNQVFCNVEKFGQARGTWLPYTIDADWGIAALQVWMRFHFYGVPTSGNSLRRSLCESVFELPESIYSDWVTRADDCLVYGGAVLGAHRYYLAAPLVEYRVHQSNNWLGTKKTDVELYRFRQRLSRMIAWYAERAGLSARMLRWAIFEFKTRPQPRFDEFLSYLWLQSQAQLPPVLKMRTLGAIAKHYLRNLWKR